MEKIEQLFRQHYSKMFLVSRMILGDEETARDVVSDILQICLVESCGFLPIVRKVTLSFLLETDV